MTGLDIETLQTQFQTHGFLLQKKLVCEHLALKWLESAHSLPSRRVICGDSDISWEERAIDPKNIFYQSVLISGLIDFSLQIGSYRKDQLRHCRMWINVYSEGEFINRHTDRAGDLQMVVCLHAEKPENGGILHVQTTGEADAAIPMVTGDVLVFPAHRLAHYTTPLTPSVNCPNPKRLTLTIRLFLNTNY